MALIALAAAGVSLAPLNSTMLIVAWLPIRDEFGVSTGAAIWLISTYLITMAVMGPTGGRLGDLYGRRLLFVGGLLVFAVASLLSALAWSYAALIVFRVAQAVAGGLLIPNGMATVREHLPAHLRGRSFGIMGAIIGVVAAAGPPLGGAIVAAADWRFIFLANIPFLVVALALAVRYLPHSELAGRRGFPDLRGSSLLLAALTFLVLTGTSLRSEEATRLALPISFMVIAVAMGALFIWSQTRAANPVVDLGLFRVRSYAAGAGGVFFINLCMYTTLIYIPLFVRDMRGGTAAEAGLYLGLLFLISMVMSNALSAATPTWYIITFLSVFGVGLGLVTAPQETAAIESQPHDRAGAAAGTYSTVRYLGSILGSAVLGAIVGGTGLTDAGDLHMLTAVLTAAAGGAVVTSLALHRWPPDVHTARKGSPIAASVSAD